MAGKTYIGASGSSASTANTTTYYALGGVVGKVTSEGNVPILFRSAGTLSNLYVRVTANTIAAASTFRTRKNLANGGQSVSIGSTATGEFTDSSGTDTIAAGDKFNYQFVPGAATNTTTFTLFSCIFEATTDTVTRTITTDTVNKTTASTTWYVPLTGSQGATAVTTETNAKTRMRKAGVLKNAWVKVVTARAQATTVRSRKNAVNGSLSVSCTGATTGEFEDTSNTDTITAGEDWNWAITTGTGVDTLNIQCIAADFVSTAGIGLIGTSHMTTVAYTDATTNYTQVSGTHTSIATEANTKADCRIAGDYSQLTCLVTQNGVTAASTVTLRKNGADSTLIASITASTTGVFSDTTHTETLVSTDEINYKITAPSVAGTQTVSITNIVMSTLVTTLARVSLQNIYKWNMDARVSLSRIYKYNVIGRTSLSRAYKYNILNRVNSASVKFDGTDDYIDCTNDATLWSQSLTKFSFSFWIYPTLAFDGSGRRVVKHNDAVAQGFCCLLSDVTSSRIQFRIKNAANTALDAFSDTISPLNKWYHVACVYDNSLGSANIKIYVDKVLGGTTINLTEAINLSAILTLADSTTDFKGYMRDFRWWTTKALTQTEITDIYNNSSAAPTPNYWLKIDEGTGNCTDVISGTKTGTLTNGPVWKNNAPAILAGLTRHYKYNVLGRVSLSRTYLWNVLAEALERISLSRIYKYNVATRVSLSRIYKYHLLGRISLSRIYKYNLLSRTSLSRIYKYHVLGRVSLSRIYKYNKIGRVSLSRIYKYNVIGRISLARIYKYNVRARVSLARIYKYHVATRVSLIRIYKYHVARRVSLSRVYKYHVAVRVSLSRIYRHHVLGRVALQRIYKYRVLGRVSLSRIYKYNKIGRISLARIYKYNVQARVSLARIYRYHILGRVSLQRIYKYNVIARVSLARIYLWNVVAEGLIRISLARTYKYHIATRVSLSRIYRFHVATRVSLSRIYKYHLLGRISLQRIYKYNVIARTSLSRVYKYNLIGRVSLPRTYKYHIQARVSLQRIYRYHILGRISLARIYRYNILVRTSLARVYKYNVIARVSLARVYKWNVLSALARISKQQIYKYHVLGRISLARIYKYNVLTRLSLARIYKYNILNRVSLVRIYKYNLLARVSAARTYKYNLLGRISLPQIYKYHVLQRISASKVYKWNVLLGLFRVSKEQIYKYDVIGRLSNQLRLRYNIASLAVTQWGKIREWIYARYAETDPSKQ